MNIEDIQGANLNNDWHSFPEEKPSGSGFCYIIVSFVPGETDGWHDRNSNPDGEPCPYKKGDLGVKIDYFDADIESDWEHCKQNIGNPDGWRVVLWRPVDESIGSADLPDGLSDKASEFVFGVR